MKAFSRAVEETALRDREAATRRGLLVRLVGATAWLAFALGHLLFDGVPSVAASVPAVGVYAGLSLVVAVALWRWSGALAYAWMALPLLDVPAVGEILWKMLPLTSSPVGVACLAMGSFFVLLSASQLSLSRVVVWMTAATAAISQCALLWRAGLPEAMPAAALLLGVGAWPLLQGPRQVRSLYERLVRDHTSLARFGRFYSPTVAQPAAAGEPGASADDAQVTLVFAELHLPGGVPDPFRSSAELEEAIASFDTAVAPLILRHGGTPDHAGSAGLQVYFLRTPALGEDAVRAVRFALEMSELLGAFNHRREQEGRPPVALGIGVHAGWAAIDRRAGPGELIALGNAVGAAAVLAQRSWASGAPVLASPETRVRAASTFTWAAGGEDAFLVGRLDVPVSGAEAPAPRRRLG